MKKSILGFIAIFLLILSPLPEISLAEQAYLSNVVLTNSKDHMLVYFSVNNCFTPEMNKAIDSGLQTTFTFFIHLYEKRSFWWDKKIVNKKISHSIKYNHLKKNYELKLSENKDQALTVNEFEKARELMAEVAAVKVLEMNKLKKGRSYQLQLMAELDKIKLPLYLHHILFFLSLWDFETDWYTIDFKH
ncbi:DUF4390 domain-containing protein [Thermodesulfobacteriota bacterium]